MGGLTMHGMTRREGCEASSQINFAVIYAVLTIRSKVHVGLGSSGAMVTQLSIACPAPRLDPPQIRIRNGSL